MFNFYLYKNSYTNANSRSIEENLVTLNDLVVNDRKDNDSFLYDYSLWDLQTTDGIFGEVVFTKMEDQQFSMIVLPKLFESMQTIDAEIIDFDDFDSKYTIYNAFYGIDFTIPEIEKCITDKNTYNKFKDINIWDVTPITFWERRESLFKKIILCPSVKDDLLIIGGAYLEQIRERLQALDQFMVNNGNMMFNYKEANLKAALNITPESTSTMNNKKLQQLRIFSMPDGRRECFELHIKTGNLRFHLLGEGSTVYIGYIGKHLSTSTFK